MTSLVNRLTRRAAELGVRVVVEEDMPQWVRGQWDRKQREIILNPALTPEQRVRTLVHELAHSILHTEPRPRPTVPFRPRSPGEEVEAEHTAFVVAALLGLEPEAALLRRTLGAALTILEGVPPVASTIERQDLAATVPMPHGAQCCSNDPGCAR